MSFCLGTRLSIRPHRRPTIPCEVSSRSSALLDLIYRMREEGHRIAIDEGFKEGLD
jgi:hypothetical protein